MGTEIATEHAQYYNQPPQAENESDENFRLRIAEVARRRGDDIVSQEIYHNKRYETGDLMNSIAGSMLASMGQGSPRSTGHRGYGDDIALGVLGLSGKEEASAELMIMAVLMEAASR